MRRKNERWNEGNSNVKPSSQSFPNLSQECHPVVDLANPLSLDLSNPPLPPPPPNPSPAPKVDPPRQLSPLQLPSLSPPPKKPATSIPPPPLLPIEPTKTSSSLHLPPQESSVAPLPPTTASSLRQSSICRTTRRGSPRSGRSLLLWELLLLRRG